MNDLISRQAVITEFSCCELTPDGGIDANYAIQFLEQMPSVQPEPSQVARDIATIIENEKDMRVIAQLLRSNSDIYNVICARARCTWRMYQDNKKLDPADPHAIQLFHEWLTLDSIARLFTDPVELETIKEIYHLNEED